MSRAQCSSGVNNKRVLCLYALGYFTWFKEHLAQISELEDTAVQFNEWFSSYKHETMVQSGYIHETSYSKGLVTWYTVKMNKKYEIKKTESI